jgi:hypothetical protein
MEPMELRDLAHKHGLDVIDFYVLMEFAKEIEELEREACAKLLEDSSGAWDDQGQTLVRMIKARGE